ncbi:MAG: OmpH family outer membrane protein [Bacteroidales bacterium]|nr:OmpH family outer membrane protein [Bacteroidales bacterium]
MKKLNLILNIVLALAVVALFVLHFTGKSSTEDKPGMLSTGEETGISSTEIVYIDIDSVLNSLDLYFDLQKKFEKKYKTSEAEFTSKQKSFQEAIQDLDYRMRKGLITRSDAQVQQQELAQEEQRLLQLQNQLQNELAEQQQVMMRQIIDSIMEYLAEVKEIHKFQYVLGTQLYGGNILYANNSLNITKLVIDGMNEKYKKQNEEKK